MKEKVIICDLDGTLFNIKHRQHLLPDYEAFNSQHINDTLNQDVFDFVKDKNILFLTGRNEKYRETTEKQLNQYFIDYKLIMRENNDLSQAKIFKKKIAQDLIKDGYDIEFAIDDDEYVCEMFFEMVIDCYDVNNGKIGNKYVRF